MAWKCETCLHGVTSQLVVLFINYMYIFFLRVQGSLKGEITTPRGDLPSISKGLLFSPTFFLSTFPSGPKTFRRPCLTPHVQVVRNKSKNMKHEQSLYATYSYIKHARAKGSTRFSGTLQRWWRLGAGRVSDVQAPQWRNGGGVVPTWAFSPRKFHVTLIFLFIYDGSLNKTQGSAASVVNNFMFDSIVNSYVIVCECVHNVLCCGAGPLLCFCVTVFLDCGYWNCSFDGYVRSVLFYLFLFFMIMNLPLLVPFCT